MKKKIKIKELEVNYNIYILENIKNYILPIVY